MIDEHRRKLEELHAKLNRDSIIDPSWYRRESVQYACVCYINNIVAAYYASNTEVMSVFLRRAHEWLTQDENRASMPEASRVQLKAYLTAVTKYLVASNEIVPPEQPD